VTLVRVLTIGSAFPGEDLAVPPVIPDPDGVIVGAGYQNVVPVTVELNPMEVVNPLQKVWEEGVADTVGVGWTVTSNVNGFPAQNVGDGPVGVIIYLTTPADVPVFCKVWFIVAGQLEAQLLKPVMVPPVGTVHTDAVQVNVVFETPEVGV
jgi:hypothetical protein